MERCPIRNTRHHVLHHRGGPATSQRGAIITRGSRRGIALVLTAIFLLVLVGITGLSLDWGKVSFNTHQAQNAADAAALAGAQKVKWNHQEAVNRAVALAGQNYAEARQVVLRPTLQPEPFDGDEAALDVILGRWVVQNREFFETLDAPNAVKAIVRRMDGFGTDARPVSLVFGGVFGTRTANVRRKATAWCFDSSGAGLICLSPDAEPGLHIQGNARLDVDHGGVQVNSIATGDKREAALYAEGNPTIDAGQINVVGSTDPSTEPGAWDAYMKDLTGEEKPFSVVSGAAPIVDPLEVIMGRNYRNLPVDAAGNYIYRTLDTISTTCKLAPGYYPGGISVTSSGVTITLDPSLDPSVPPVYFFGGASKKNVKSGLYMTGGNLIGHGVTLYITKDFVRPTGQYGEVNLQGNGIIDLTSPGEEMDPNMITGELGIAIWQDPSNPQPATFNGTADMSVIGTLYFPTARVDIEGTPGQMGNQIIAGSVAVNGRARILVNYDGRNNIPGNSKIVIVE